MEKCKFCDFSDSKYFTKDHLLLEKYDYKQIKALGASIQKNIDGEDPQIVVWTSVPDLGVQSGFSINYCPICGRKLN